MSGPPRQAPTGPRETLATRYQMHQPHAPLHQPPTSITALPPSEHAPTEVVAEEGTKADEHGGWGYDEQVVEDPPVKLGRRRHVRSVDYHYHHLNGHSGQMGPVEQVSFPTPYVREAPAQAGETAILPDQVHQVPTFTGAIPPQFRGAATHDPNRMAVPKPRTWGAAPAPASPPSAPAEDIQPLSARGWTPAPDRVQAWAAGVAPASPTEISRQPTQTSIPACPASPPSTPPVRADSAPPHPRPVRVEYTPSVSEKNLPTPPAQPHTAEERPADLAELPTDWAEDVPVQKVPSVVSVRHRPFRVGPPPENPFWWKNNPHPAYSPTWESRRIIVGLPMAISKARIEQSMIDHFSRYGPVKLVYASETNGDNCNSVFVTFENEESAIACLADPTAVDCIFRSNYTHSGAGTPIALTIRPGHFENSARTLHICITGPRFDDPPSTDRNGRKANKKLALPQWIYIDGVPRMRKLQTFVKRYPAVRPMHQTKEEMEARALEQTGKEVWPITEIYLGKEVQEKDIIPRLCNIFGEVLDVVPPAHGQGAWFVTMASYQDATRVLDQIAKIPGMTARLTNASDHIGYTSSDHLASPDKRDALTRLADYLGCPVARDDVIPPRPAVLATPTTARSSLRDLPATPGATPGHVRSGRTHRKSLPPLVESAYEPSLAPPPATPGFFPPQDEIDPRYPHLRKRKVATYKGRPLRLDVDVMTGEERYWDDRAIHIGRLDKGRETETTIYNRFKGYGEINQIEYNPRTVTTSYATARVLYRDEASAERAIAEQNGAISFGSQIKVEPRRVRADNAIIVEKFFDVNGRVLNLSEASQCSPPHTHAHIDPTHMPHPPPFAGYPMPPPGWPVQHVHTQYWHSVHPSLPGPAPSPGTPGLMAPYPGPPYPAPPTVPAEQLPTVQSPPLPPQASGLGMGLHPSMYSELTAMGVRFQPGPYIHHHIIPFYPPPPHTYPPPGAPPFSTAFPQPSAPLGAHMTPPHAPDHALHVHLPTPTAPATPPREEIVFASIATPSHLLSDIIDQQTPPPPPTGAAGADTNADAPPETELIQTPGGTTVLAEKKRLLPKETVFEHGVLRAVYDQGDVEAYWKSLGIEPPPPRSSTSARTSAAGSEGATNLASAFGSEDLARTPADNTPIPNDPAIVSTAPSAQPPAGIVGGAAMLDSGTGTPFTSISPAHSALAATGTLGHTPMGTTPLAHFTTLLPGTRPPSALSRVGSSVTTPRTQSQTLPERSEEANYGPVGSPAQPLVGLPPVHPHDHTQRRDVHVHSVARGQMQAQGPRWSHDRITQGGDQRGGYAPRGEGGHRRAPRGYAGEPRGRFANSPGSHPAPGHGVGVGVGHGVAPNGADSRSEGKSGSGRGGEFGGW